MRRRLESVVPVHTVAGDKVVPFGEPVEPVIPVHLEAGVGGATTGVKAVKPAIPRGCGQMVGGIGVTPSIDVHQNCIEGGSGWRRVVACDTKKEVIIGTLWFIKYDDPFVSSTDELLI